MTRFLPPLFALAFGCVLVDAAEIEYLPPVRWAEPPVVAPGDKSGSPPSDAIVLFDGSDFSQWRNAQNWRIEDGAAVCGPGRLFTRQEFGDCQLHVEWSAPTVIKGHGQGRGNSGIHMMSFYEVQILDSFKNKTYPEGQAAAIYKQTPPMVNATLPPGEWNTYDILWTAPRWDGVRLASPACVSVLHNGVLVVDRHEVQGETGFDRPAMYRAQRERGPITLQYHGNEVRYRNIWVRELSPPKGELRPARYVNHRTGSSWPADAPPPVGPVEIEEIKDIDYVGDGNPRQTLNLMLPPRDADRRLPLVAFIHGGGWHQGKKDRANIVRAMAQTGRFAGASIGYRLSDEAIWPAQLHDCKAALRWLHANADRYGYDANRIGMWGISAGGHLVAMLAVTQDDPAMGGQLGPHLDQPTSVSCVVNWFGPADLTTMDAQGVRTPVAAADSPPSRLVGGPVPERIEAARDASPLFYARPNAAPMLIVHGTRDPLVPFEQSVELSHALESVGAPVALLAVFGAGHGGLGENANQRCRDFLEAHLMGGEYPMGFQSVAGPRFEKHLRPEERPAE